MCPLIISQLVAIKIARPNSMPRTNPSIFAFNRTTALRSLSSSGRSVCAIFPLSSVTLVGRKLIPFVNLRSNHYPPISAFVIIIVESFVDNYKTESDILQEVSNRERLCFLSGHVYKEAKRKISEICK